MKLTDKIKKLFIRQRDAPRAVGIVTQTDWDLLFAGGYVPLYSCPEVAMCVDAIADLVSNMTLRLMRNTDTGDVRVVNGLSRAIDIMPNAYQNRKAFVYNIVSTLLTVGNGNCVVVPRFDADGNLLIIHCSGGANGVVITGAAGFTAVARPETMARLKNNIEVFGGISIF